MVNPADTLPARARSVRLKHVDELSELVHDIFDPKKRERISNRAVQTLLADMADRAALEGKSACRLWDDVWREIAEKGEDDPSCRGEAAIVLQVAMRFIDVIREACALMAQGGYPVMIHTDLDAARGELADRLVEATTTPGPEPNWDPAQLAAAKAEEAVDARAILRELQGEE